jgi:hypothetical protein
MNADKVLSRPLSGHAVLIVETNISAASDLQDALADAGARILTAYTFERACLHAETSQLSAAIINNAFSSLEKKKLSDLLSTRNVPFVGSSDCTPHQYGGRSDNPVTTVARIVKLVRSSAGNRDMERILLGTRSVSTASGLIGQSR